MLPERSPSHSRGDLTRIQADGVEATAERAYERVSLFRERLDAAGLAPRDVTPETLVDVPFTTKEDFRDHYPDGLFAVGRSDLRRIHASSGTTGKPKVVGYTEHDLTRWARLVARTLETAGVAPGDTVQNAVGYGLFTGGLGFHDGVEELGACVIPTGGGNTKRQIELLQDLSADAAVLIPSYALYVAETAAEVGVDPGGLTLSTVLLGAEPSTRAMRDEIGDRFDAVATENYGLSELMGPGVATECAEARDGMHLWEDAFYPEVVDPETGERLPEGEEGELVLTAIGAETLPLLRYRTGDVVRLTRDPCDCGRTHCRISVVGRSDDLLIVRGVNVYPTEVEAVVLEFDRLSPQYRVDLEKEGSMDRIEITVERAEDVPASAVDGLEADLTDRLADVLQLTPDEVTVVAHGAFERTEVGKAKRVYDHRGN